MITWLFTQVWLWSLAAFALGALITWLLFVRPLQRRLAEYAEEYSDYDYDRDSGYDEPGTVQEPLDLLHRPQASDEPLDLLHRLQASDEPPIGDWDRPPRAWADPRLRQVKDEDTENTWFRKWDEEEPDGTPDIAVTAVQPRVSPAAEHGPDTDVWVAPEADESAASAEDTAVTPVPSDSEVVESSPEPDAAVTPVEREPEPPWFSGKLDDDGGERLSGQLRSLFESVESKSESETPYVPPVGAEATKVMPEATDEGDADGVGEAVPLPQRTPGASPHPGRDSGWTYGPMIKGHSASRQYHSPDSPQYDDIVADVWFRSAADAEIAGFEPWNGQRARD
ncbi:sunset domain-containing protein [Saccharopolyspora sp. NPDC002376]